MPPKRPIDASNADGSAAMRIHTESSHSSANDNGQINEASTQSGSLPLSTADDQDSQKLVNKIKDILDEQETLLCKLYPSKKANNCKIETNLRNSIQSLRDQLTEAEKVKITVAVFGDLGKGKSYLLNDVLRYGLGDEEFRLLPSDYGDSQTPVPIRIHYGEAIEVKKMKKEGCEEKTLATHQEAAAWIKEVFTSQELTDLICVDVSINLPVFKHLQEKLKSECHYQGINVEVEFVDLPGKGDNHGNALIGKQLDNCDVILLFKGGASGRPVSIEDLQSVFRKRKLFDFVNRPKFVVIENDRENRIKENKESQENEEQKWLGIAWNTLIENLYKEDTEYQIVKERLPLTQEMHFLEKFKEESKAIIFGQNHKDFLGKLCSALCQHMNEVVLKKNIHPVLLDIHQNASIMGKRISALMTKQSKEVKKERPFYRLEYNPIEFVFTIDKEDENFIDNLKSEFDNLKLGQISNMLTAHQDLMDLFQQETTVQYLTNRLKAALLEHSQKLLDETKCKNESHISDPEAFAQFAERSCKRKINLFINKDDGGQNFVKSCLKKVESKKPRRVLKKQWTTSSEDERNVLLEEHCDMAWESLLSFLSKSSRRQGQASLLNLREDLRKSIDEWMWSGVNVDNAEVKMQYLEDSKKQSKYHRKFSELHLKKVNPHLSTKNKVLDSSEPIPHPLIMHNEKTASVLPPIDHTSNMQSVFKMLLTTKKKKGVLNELRKKLKLPVGSLLTPQGKDEFAWSRILLNVLFDSTFHHEAFGDSQLPSGLKLDSIHPDDMVTAKQQLFAFQKSTVLVSCKILESESKHRDVIRIHINDSKDGLTAELHYTLKSKLEKLKCLEDFKKELAPIFIPSIHCGKSKDNLGNLYLEENPWEPKLDDDDDDDNSDDPQTDGTPVVQPATGLENLTATIFCVVEPDHLDKFKSNFQNPPSNIDFLYVVLPQNGRGIGVSRSVIKVLAECLEIPFYWTIDDDVKRLQEYIKNEHDWKDCTSGRALLYSQHVLKHCIDKAVICMDYLDRVDKQPEFSQMFPKWARLSLEKSIKLLVDKTVHERAMANFPFLDPEFNDEIMNTDCNVSGKVDLSKVAEWCKAKDHCIKRFKEIFQGDTRRIGRVSIGHVSGRRSNYHSISKSHYRKSCQNYQMVLHNAEAIKGFNYVTDEVLLKYPEGTVQEKKLRDVRHYGHKWEDKSFCKALEFYGITGYQIITLVQHNEKLRNAFGRVGNTYKPEEVGGDQSEDESNNDISENEQDSDPNDE